MTWREFLVELRNLWAELRSLFQAPKPAPVSYRCNAPRMPGLCAGTMQPVAGDLFKCSACGREALA